MIKKAKVRKNVLSIFMLFFLAACSSANPQGSIDRVDKKDSEAIITVIDVGQGSSAVIQSEDSVILIDAGEKEYGDKVVGTLKELGIKKIDAAIGTHSHSDHIGGMSEVLEQMKVKKLYLPDVISTSYTFEHLLDVAKQQNIKTEIPKPGKKLKVGTGSMQFMAPKENADYGTNMNAYSIVTKFTFGQVSYLTGGDLDMRGFQDFINSDYDISSTIFQAFHHGSYNGTNTVDFLDKVNPSVILMSVGENNLYGHPHQELLDYVNNRGMAMYRTDIHGDITVSIKDGTFSITTLKKEDASPNNEQTYQGEVIGNKHSKKYHKPECKNLPYEENRIYFETAEEAVTAGYTASKDCF